MSSISTLLLVLTLQSLDSIRVFNSSMRWTDGWSANELTFAWLEAGRQAGRTATSADALGRSGREGIFMTPVPLGCH